MCCCCPYYYKKGNNWLSVIIFLLVSLPLINRSFSILFLLSTTPPFSFFSLPRSSYILPSSFLSASIIGLIYNSTKYNKIIQVIIQKKGKYNDIIICYSFALLFPTLFVLVVVYSLYRRLDISLT